MSTAPEIVCVGMALADVLVRGFTQAPSGGETAVVDAVSLTVGGDALNQAMTLARLGHRSGLVTVVGDDSTGEFVRRSCADAGVDVSQIVTDPTLTTTTSVVLIDADGERSFLSPRGGTIDRFGPAHVDVEALPSGLKVLSVGSLLCSAALDHDVLPVLLDRAHALGALTVADMVTDRADTELDDMKDVLSRIDVLVPSESESRHFTGQDDPHAAAAAFARHGVGLVVIKRGSRGALAIGPDGDVSAPAYNVPVVDTTGSGDNFVAGLVSGLACGLPLADCLRRATATAAVSVQAIGATTGVRNLAQVEDLIHSGRPPKPIIFHGSDHLMTHRIADIKVHLVSAPVPGPYADATRKVETIGFTIVRIITDEGLEGIGVTYHEVGGEATKVLIEKNFVPRLLGRDPLETEVIYHEFVGYLRGIGRKGLMFCALSAIDIALWDLKGKIFDLPLFRLLGGNKSEVPVYASGGWTSYDDDELVAEIVSMVKAEYSMVKFKVGVEGGTNLRQTRDVAAVREAVGPEIGIMLDANNCWDAATGVQFANRVREYDIMWLEEPVPADDIPGLARFRRGTDIPLATGEHEYTKFGVRDLLLNEAADIVQVDGARGGGYTEMLKIAALTQAWNVKFAPHAMENLQAHLVSAVPNALFLERLLMFEDITAKVFKNVPTPRSGVMPIPDKPGLGLDLDMDYITEHDEIG